MTALILPFVLGGSGDASGLSFSCCPSVVLCCFDELPSVVLSSNPRLDDGMPSGTAAGVAMLTSVVVVDADASAACGSVGVVVVCFFAASSSSTVG